MRVISQWWTDGGTLLDEFLEKQGGELFLIQKIVELVIIVEMVIMIEITLMVDIFIMGGLFIMVGDRQDRQMTFETRLSR